MKYLTKMVSLYINLDEVSEVKMERPTVKTERVEIKGQSVVSVD